MPRSKIELRHVRYIIAAAQSGSFRRAAQDLGVEQSAISRRSVGASGMSRMRSAPNCFAVTAPASTLRR
ncbi:MAG: LysR family transcriptional regulator [Reyranella sp.]